MNKLIFLLILFITSGCSKDFKTIIVSNIWDGGNSGVDHYEFTDNGSFIHTTDYKTYKKATGDWSDGYHKGQGEWSRN